MNGVMALILLCAGQSGMHGDEKSIKNESTLIAIPYQGKGFIVYQGEGFTLTQASPNVYKFERDDMGKSKFGMHTIGSYNFANGLLVVDKYWNMPDLNTPESDPLNRWAFMAYCKDPNQSKGKH